MRVYQLTFQQRVAEWFYECFSIKLMKFGDPKLSRDKQEKQERTHCFLVEALELAQSFDCTNDEAHQLVDYVYGAPAGDMKQKIGGVMFTLAGLCSSQSFDMQELGEVELSRAWKKIEQIREKTGKKPALGLLPE